ncbi:MAG TPA: cytochrome c-type biogenesis protein [Actinomycetota bacterium]|nr:cytochrome c-type biogenesis protein [Actinomycetota bacterium]
MRGGARAAGVVVATALLAAGAALLAAALRGPDRPRTLEERVREVASGLRCPVCQNLSVADSPSRLAHEMRARIARDLRAGKTEEEVRAEFVRAYGEWVLLEPPRRGLSLLPWLVPGLLLAGGAGVAVALVRRWTGPSRAAGGKAEEVSARGEVPRPAWAEVPGPPPEAGPPEAGPPEGELPPRGLTEEDRRLLEEALLSLGEEPE